MVDILVAMSTYGCEAVEVACSLAIQEGVVNATTILNTITRLECKEPSQEAKVDDVIKLKQPPTDNCQRYDQLLKEASNG